MFPSSNTDMPASRMFHTTLDCLKSRVELNQEVLATFQRFQHQMADLC